MSAQGYPPEKAGQPGGASLPTRSTTATTDSAGYISDEEAVPDAQPSDTVGLLLERLQAWKHACGYLENYISANEKLQKHQAKEYDRVLKTISNPLKEGHHFDQALGGVAGFFENMRSNTHGLANSHIETAKNLDGSVLPILTRLHGEIKSKNKELTGGAGKAAKAVDEAKNTTQKQIELLGQHTAAFDSAGGRVDPKDDPYVLHRGIRYRLHRQVLEENNSRQDLISVQKNFEAFEEHVVQTLQQAMGTFLQYVGGRADREKVMYTDIVGSVQRIPPTFEWINFLHRNENVMINPDSPPKDPKHLVYANQEHASTKPLIAGTLERKSRGVGSITGYKTGYYAVTPSRYLHQFADDDDFRKDPVPELSLYLPDCTVGAVSDTRFNVKGKDISKGKIGNTFQMAHELAFKAHTPADAQKWHEVLSQSAGGSTNEAPNSAVTSPTSPTAGGQQQMGGLSAATAATPAAAASSSEKSPAATTHPQPQTQTTTTTATPQQQQPAPIQTDTKTAAVGSEPASAATPSSATTAATAATPSGSQTSGTLAATDSPTTTTTGHATTAAAGTNNPALDKEVS